MQKEVTSQKSTNNPMSIFGLIEENMEQVIQLYDRHIPKLDFEICTIPGQSKDSSDIEEVGEVINKAGPSKKVGAGDDSDIEELDEAEDEEDDLMGDGEEGEEEEEESEEGKQSYRFPPSIRCLIVK